MEVKRHEDIGICTVLAGSWYAAFFPVSIGNMDCVSSCDFLVCWLSFVLQFLRTSMESPSRFFFYKMIKNSQKTRETIRRYICAQ